MRVNQQKLSHELKVIAEKFIRFHLASLILEIAIVLQNLEVKVYIYINSVYIYIHTYKYTCLYLYIHIEI